MRPIPSFTLMENMAKAAQVLGGDIEDVHILTPYRCDRCHSLDNEAFPLHLTIGGRFWADLCNDCYDALQREQAQAYQAALVLVARIDEDLRQGTRHYRDTEGRLLTTLEAVVNAIPEDRWLG